MTHWNVGQASCTELYVSKVLFPALESGPGHEILDICNKASNKSVQNGGWKCLETQKNLFCGFGLNWLWFGQPTSSRKHASLFIRTQTKYLSHDLNGWTVLVPDLPINMPFLFSLKQTLDSRRIPWLCWQQSRSCCLLEVCFYAFGDMCSFSVFQIYWGVGLRLCV